MIERFQPNCDQDPCCVDLMQPFINHVNSFTIELEFQNGDCIEISPWEVSEVVESDDRWTAIRQNTQEYENVDTEALKQQSKLLYAKHHHWGTFEAYKKSHCPLR